MNINADALHLDDLLVIVAVVLFFAQIFSLRWGLQLRSQIPSHEPGANLLRILMTVAVVNAAAQGLSVVNAFLLAVDPIYTIDVRIIVFLVVEALLASAIIWSMWQLRRLP